MRSHGSRVSMVAALVLALLVAMLGEAGQAAFADLPGQRQAPLAATTRYVCKSGCTYSSITAAVNASSSGDTIKVAQGTYNGSVQVRNKSLTIRGGYSASNWNAQDPGTYKTVIQAGGGSPAVKLVSNSGNHTGTIDGFTITGANNSGGGGGVSVNKYRATISHNVIECNRAADGAGIRVQDATVSILGNTIRNNTAAKNGGGIHLIRGAATIDNNTIRRNVSQQLGGGGIMVRGDSRFTIANSRIKYNRSLVGGGGIRIEDSEGTIQDNEIMYNTTSNIGGGLAVVRSDVDVGGNTIRSNRGVKGGGGMQFSQGSTGLISNNRLVKNQIGSDAGGGGIHFWQCAPQYGGAPQFIGNTVTGNTSNRVGGGIHVEDSTLLIRGNVITDNHAADQGGGVNIIVNSAPTLIRNTIARNTASVKGGGIYGYNSAPKIRRNEIVDNQAPTAAGIHLAGCRGLEITNNMIARNKATIEGGGIHLASNSRGNIINNTLVNNNLGAGGEAIDLRNNTRPRIANNIIVGHKYGIRVREQAAPIIEYNDVWDSSVRNYDGVRGGPGAISCNPQFVNRARGDYHLTAGSCAIDNGTASGTPTNDFDGDHRPLDGDKNGNSAWDRGADEFSR
jgi:parallel beta-helix repeat protein